MDGLTMAINSRTYRCQHCHDTGYTIGKMSSAEAYGPALADWPDVDIAIPCPYCGGRAIPQGDIGFPKEFAEANINHFQWDVYGKDMGSVKETVNTFWQSYSAWSMEGMGLYIWSETRGSGKTFLACCLGQSVREKYHVSVKFTTSVDYLAAATESYREENRGRDITQAYRECELLILDDLGAENRSQKNNWTDKEFFQLLEGRFSQDKVTIITSNVPISKLNIDDRISSRINAKNIILKLPEVSIRQRKADDKKKQFIDRLTRI